MIKKECMGFNRSQQNQGETMGVKGRGINMNQCDYKAESQRIQLVRVGYDRNRIKNRNSG